MARTIPYRGKQGKEHGQWEFLQRSEMPSDLMLFHTSGNDEAIAQEMRLDCMNQDGSQYASNLFNYMTEEEYFAMWDKIDTKGLFRNGELTPEAKARCLEEKDCRKQLNKILLKEEEELNKENFERHKQKIEQIQEIRKEEEEEKQIEAERIARKKQRMELRDYMRNQRGSAL